MNELIHISYIVVCKAEKTMLNVRQEEGRRSSPMMTVESVTVESWRKSLQNQ